MESWPSSFELFGTLERVQEPSVRHRDPQSVHAWAWTGATWHCHACLRVSADPKRVVESFGRLPLLFHKVVQQRNGHHIWVGQLRKRKAPSGLFIYCARCARYGLPRSIRDLVRVCPGGPTSQNYVRFARNFSQGIHPRGEQFLRPWPLGCFSETSAFVAELSVEPVVHSVEARGEF